MNVESCVASGRECVKRTRVYRRCVLAWDVVMDEFVIATGNPHKVEELRAILAGIGVRILGLADLEAMGEGPFAEPAETGSTFEANATIKALSYAEQTGRACLADDSGLEIDALAGRPGVISSHYCTDGREVGHSREERDRLNNDRVLREMEGVVEQERGARFVCVMVLAEGAKRATESRNGGGGILPPFGPGPRQSGDLPHWEVPHGTYFVTFRLAEGMLSMRERHVVLDACCHWHEKRIWLHVCVVMPDHVHMIFRFIEGERAGALSSLIHSIKSSSAKGVNALRGTSGKVWQQEYFDRFMRTGRETREAIAYVELNPVRSGLVEKPFDYPLLWCQPLGQGPSRRLEAAAPATPVRILATVRGCFEGRIGKRGDVPRGSNGFGYDPLFLVGPEFTRTSAEMSSAEKNAVSHRARAGARMADEIRRIARGGG